MPDPKPGEKKNIYIQRCMGDQESVADFPQSTQRYAFCQSKWKELKEDAVTAGDASRAGLIAEDVGKKRSKTYMSLAELKRILPMIMSEGRGK